MLLTLPPVFQGLWSLTPPYLLTRRLPFSLLIDTPYSRQACLSFILRQATQVSLDIYTCCLHLHLHSSICLLSLEFQPKPRFSRKLFPDFSSHLFLSSQGSTLRQPQPICHLIFFNTSTTFGEKSCGSSAGPSPIKMLYVLRSNTIPNSQCSLLITQ